MTNQHNIFQRLAEYEVQPPPGVLLRILDILNAEKENNINAFRGSFERIQNISIQPPLGSYEFIENKIEDPLRLSRLQDIEVTPPTPVFEKVFDKIVSGRKRMISVEAAVKTLAPYRFQAAAALIILLVGGWLIYKSIENSGLPMKESMVKKTDPVVPALTDTASKMVVIKNNTIARKVSPVIYSGQAGILIGEDGFKLNVVDNDLLGTFAGFSYGSLPLFMKKQQNESFVINVDQYAAVSVSESMGKMMKRMNTFRRNGKLTHKAKKERRRLNRWKKADEKRFDQSFDKNPLDPVDLGEFIFN